MSARCPFASRRLFMALAGAAAGGLGARVARAADATSAVEPFWGAHQGGILTPAQDHTYFAAFDVEAKSAKALAGLLQRWTDAAARMTAGETCGG